MLYDAILRFMGYELDNQSDAGFEWALEGGAEIA